MPYPPSERSPTFVLVAGTTGTGRVPGISAAGADPEMVDYTPSADAELVLEGECRCMDGVPVSPEGIPTPAVVTRAALELLDASRFVVDAGLSVQPVIPRMDVGAESGGNIRKPAPVPRAEEVFRRSRELGRALSGPDSYLIVAETIPGGTTTALGVLRALGSRHEVSSSLPENPKGLKEEVVQEGLGASGIEEGELGDEPIRAVQEMGDPVQAAVTGIASGAESPVYLAGGTQMGTIAALLDAMDDLECISIATTRWIMEDPSSDMESLADDLGVDIYSSNLSFADSGIEGLRAYEAGVVKEGVGAGAAALLAEELSEEELLPEIERVYRELVE